MGKASNPPVAMLLPPLVFFILCLGDSQWSFAKITWIVLSSRGCHGYYTR